MCSDMVDGEATSEREARDNSDRNGVEINAKREALNQGEVSVHAEEEVKQHSVHTCPF